MQRRKVHQKAGHTQIPRQKTSRRLIAKHHGELILEKILLKRTGANIPKTLKQTKTFGKNMKKIFGKNMTPG